jgi:hypothetical protein
MKITIFNGIIYPLLVGGLFTPFPIYAGISLICENPGREYLVMYEQGSPFLLLNPDSDATKYRVVVDDNSDGSHVITAETFAGGPTAQLHLRPYQKMEFWSDGQLMQTDACYLKN